MVKVIVVDDHPIFRLGLAASLAEMDQVELVGEAATAAEVLDLVERTSPDLALLDLHLPDRSGLEVNRWLAAKCPDVKVVVLTMSEDHHAAVAAIRDGARGYIVKGADPTHIERVLESVIAGDVVLDYGVAQAMAELAQLRATTVSSPFPQLSPRFRIVPIRRDAYLSLASVIARARRGTRSVQCGRELARHVAGDH
jgi:DNA-binding NarL/FixJ family response regulator